MLFLFFFSVSFSSTGAQCVVEGEISVVVADAVEVLHDTLKMRIIPRVE